MIDLGLMAEGGALLMTWQIPLAIFGGMLLGLVIGTIPGMTAALGLAVVLPLTFQTDAMTALMLMTSVYTGSLTGGGFLAVLLNTPGTPGAAATTFDGYPMAKSGRQNEALGLQIAASVLGGFLSYLALLIFIQPMARFALLFGTPEMLFLTIFVILTIATLQNKSWSRTIFAGLLGLLLSTIGPSVATGVPRGTFDIPSLEDGLPIILCVIGLFAVPEMIAISGRKAISESATAGNKDFGRMLGGVRAAFSYPVTWLRGSAIGVFVGLLPAAGATIASLLSYSSASRVAREGEVFGEGEPKGVVAAESANNSSEGGAMAVLMSLGVPGSASTAVILSAFLLHGLVPGPRLFLDNGPLVYGLIIGNMLQMVVLGVFALFVAFYAAKIVIIPSRVLTPILVILLAVGAYSFRGYFGDVVITFVFGLIGHAFRRRQFSLLAMMVGLFLGDQLDQNIVRFVILYGETPLDLLERPISIALAVLSLGLIAFQIYRGTRRVSADAGP